MRDQEASERLLEQHMSEDWGVQIAREQRERAGKEDAAARREKQRQKRIAAGKDRLTIKLNRKGA